MIARYKGQLVPVIRVEAHRATIVWRGMLRRVNPADLIDVTLIAGLLLAAALWCVVAVR